MSTGASSDDLEGLTRAFETGGPEEGLVLAAALERAEQLARALSVLRRCSEMDLYGSSEFRGMTLDREIAEATRRIEQRLGIAVSPAPAAATAAGQKDEKRQKTHVHRRKKRGPEMPPIPTDADPELRAKYEAQASDMLDFGVQPPAFESWLAAECGGGASGGGTSSKGPCECAAGLRSPIDNPHLVEESRPAKFEIMYRCGKCGQRWACESDVGYHFPVHHMRRID
jgi:hypothetical protein